MKQERVSEWADALAKRLGRPVDQIATHGLNASDFTDAEVEHADGSRLLFKNAFFLVDPQQQRVAVFTEHLGHFEFDLSMVRIHNLTRQTFWPDEGV